MDIPRPREIRTAPRTKQITVPPQDQTAAPCELRPQREPQRQFGASYHRLLTLVVLTLITGFACTVTRLVLAVRLNRYWHAGVPTLCMEQSLRYPTTHLIPTQHSRSKRSSMPLRRILTTLSRWMRAAQICRSEYPSAKCMQYSHLLVQYQHWIFLEQSSYRGSAGGGSSLDGAMCTHFDGLWAGV